MAREFINTVRVNGFDVDIYGCWGDDDRESYDFYDLYLKGECINEYEPYYKLPTKKDIIICLDFRKKLKLNRATEEDFLRDIA